MQIFLFVIFNCIQIIFSKFFNIPLFLGNSSIEVYLSKHFSNTENNLKNLNSLYLIDNFIFDNNLTMPVKNVFSLHIYLKHKNIQHFHFNSVNLENIQNILPKKTEYHSREITLIIEQRNMQLSLRQFEMFLSVLSKIHNNCLLCRPFIILLNVPFETLKNYAINSVSKFQPNFQAILVTRLANELLSRLLINPTINGCILYKGVYLPKSKIDYEKLEVPYWKCNLNQATLNVSVNHWMPFCHVVRHSNKSVTLYHSMESELLAILKSVYNFTTVLVDGKDSWGMERNGRWGGMVGQVLYGKSNLALCGIGRRKDRLQVVDFTSHISTDELTYIIQAPAFAARHWIVSRPFGWHIWLCILLSFTILTTVHYIKSSLAIDLVIFRLFSISINQSMNRILKEPQPFSRQIYGLWMFAVLILACSYSSCFYSILTVPEYEHTIESLEELVDAARRDAYYILTWNGSSYLSQFLYAEKENHFYYTIGLHMNRTTRKMVQNEVDQFTLLEESQRNIIVTSRAYTNKYYRHFSRKRLLVGRENFEILYTGMVLPKRSLLKKPFNLIIKRMGEFGLFEFWTRGDNFEKMLDRQSKRGNIRILGLTDMRSIFIVWSIGLAGAILGLVTEVVQSKTRKRNNIWKLSVDDTQS